MAALSWRWKRSFDHAVRLRVVACCIVSDNAKLITQIIPQSGFKLPSIGGDSGRGPKTSYPPAEEKKKKACFGFNIYD